MTSDNMTTAEQPNAERRAEIARRAYELYLERGGAAGKDLDDWLSAERELLDKDRELAQSGRRETEKDSAAASRRPGPKPR
jgi:outer membrane protein TolC